MTHFSSKAKPVGLYFSGTFSWIFNPFAIEFMIFKILKNYLNWPEQYSLRWIPSFSGIFLWLSHLFAQTVLLHLLGCWVPHHRLRVQCWFLLWLHAANNCFYYLKSFLKSDKLVEKSYFLPKLEQRTLFTLIMEYWEKVGYPK